jgi:hypothetical protein
MSNNNISSRNLIRITDRAYIQTGEYYLLKSRMTGKPREDYIAYLVSEPNAASMVFKFIWFRSARKSENDKYNDWNSVSKLRPNVHNFIIIVRPRDLDSGNILIYSLGSISKSMDKNINPDISLQMSKVTEEIKARNDSNGNERIPSLQYLASMALPHDDMMLVKDKTNLDPNRVTKYLPQNGGIRWRHMHRHRNVKTKKNKSHRKFKKQRKTKKQRK